MFDDENNSTPANLPVPPTPPQEPVIPVADAVDPFADSDPVVEAPRSTLPPSEPLPSPTLPESSRPDTARAPLAPVAPEASSGKGVFLLVFGMLTLILIVLGVAAFLAYRELISLPAEQAPVTEITIPDLEPPVEEPTTPEPVVTSTVDTDNDGLTDAEEARYGTDADRSDTDNDGLPDKDEVQKYDTDPLDPDTDGDTFLDGVEVISGYDPKGPGKLVDLPK